MQHNELETDGIDGISLHEEQRNDSLTSNNEKANRSKAKAKRKCKEVKQQQKKHKSDREKVILENYITQQQNDIDDFEGNDSSGELNFFTQTSTPLKNITNIS